MRPRPRADIHAEKTFKEIRAAVGQALATTFAKKRLPISSFISRCELSRTIFYNFIAGQPPTIYMLDRMSREMGLRLQVSLVPANMRARPATVDPLDLAALRQRGIAGRRLIDLIGQLIPLPPAVPSDEQLRKALAKSSSFMDAARRLGVARDWVERTCRRRSIPIPFTVAPAPPRLTEEEQKVRQERIRAGMAAGLTFRGLGKELGISYERVRQIALQMGLRRRRKGRGKAKRATPVRPVRKAKPPEVAAEAPAEIPAEVPPALTAPPEIQAVEVAPSENPPQA